MQIYLLCTSSEFRFLIFSDDGGLVDDICNDRDDDDNNEDYPGRGVGVTVGLSVRWHRQGFGIICACTRVGKLFLVSFFSFSLSLL